MNNNTNHTLDSVGMPFNKESSSTLLSGTKTNPDESVIDLLDLSDDEEDIKLSELIFSTVTEPAAGGVIDLLDSSDDDDDLPLSHLKVSATTAVGRAVGRRDVSSVEPRASAEPREIDDGDDEVQFLFAKSVDDIDSFNGGLSLGANDDERQDVDDSPDATPHDGVNAVQNSVSCPMESEDRSMVDGLDATDDKEEATTDTSAEISSARRSKEIRRLYSKFARMRKKDPHTPKPQTYLDKKSRFDGLKKGDEVLVTDGKSDSWYPVEFGFYTPSLNTCKVKFASMSEFVTWHPDKVNIPGVDEPKSRIVSSDGYIPPQESHSRKKKPKERSDLERFYDNQLGLDLPFYSFDTKADTQVKNRGAICWICIEPLQTGDIIYGVDCVCGMPIHVNCGIRMVTSHYNSDDCDKPLVCPNCKKSFYHNREENARHWKKIGIKKAREMATEAYRKQN